jgi:hypothetical protein
MIASIAVSTPAIVIPTTAAVVNTGESSRTDQGGNNGNGLTRANTKL